MALRGQRVERFLGGATEQNKTKKSHCCSNQHDVTPSTQRGTNNVDVLWESICTLIIKYFCRVTFQPAQMDDCLFMIEQNHFNRLFSNLPTFLSQGWNIKFSQLMHQEALTRSTCKLTKNIIRHMWNGEGSLSPTSRTTYTTSDLMEGCFKEQRGSHGPHIRNLV